MFRQPDLSFESVIYPPIEWTESGDRDHDVQTIMQKLMDTLQDVVRDRPDMWYMFRPMWPAQPPETLVPAPSTRRDRAAG
jgi:lauroyl/myristoyl acyltransferase